MMQRETLKTIAYSMPTPQLTKLAADLRKAGYDVVRDNDAGTLVVKADGEVVVRGLQTGRGRGWIVRADPKAITVTS